MGCRICGDTENVAYRDRSRMVLCGTCHKATPRKVTRDEFERAYWAGDENVPASIRQGFWDDYRTSTYGSVLDYIKATVSTD